MTAISPNVVVTILLNLKGEHLGKRLVHGHSPTPFFNSKCKSLNSHFAIPFPRFSSRARLQMKWRVGLGLNKGIHTVILSMLALNDVIAIFLFNVLCGIVFPTGDLSHQILQGPVGIVMGCVFGTLSGLLVLRLPSDKSVRGGKRSLSENTFNLKCKRELFIRFGEHFCAC